MRTHAREISMYADNVRMNAGVVGKRADNASENTEVSRQHANGVSTIAYILSYSAHSGRNDTGNPSDNASWSGNTIDDVAVGQMIKLVDAVNHNALVDNKMAM